MSAFFVQAIILGENSVDPDKAAHDEPPYLDLRCFRFILCAGRVKIGLALRRGGQSSDGVCLD